MKRKKSFFLPILIIVVLLVLILPTIFMRTSLAEWYPTLKKPLWSPYSWVFGVVWPVLYTLMVVSMYLVWLRRISYLYPLASILFWSQLFVNFAFTFLFFGLRSPLLGLIDVFALTVLVLFMTITFWKIRPLAGALQIPYLLWCCFALGLSYSIWIMN